MKYALVNGVKAEAKRRSRGECVGCGAEMLAKCGDKYVHHWAHKSGANCDVWWENETAWHRRWKGYFPIEWQEVVHKDSRGERHIADVKTGENWVFEFQHSPISAGERDSRNIFYEKLVWVVDGKRRKRDLKAFNDVLVNSKTNKALPDMHCSQTWDDSTLLKDWVGSDAFVFFDFGGGDEGAGGDYHLWFILPVVDGDTIFLSSVLKSKVISAANEMRIAELLDGVVRLVKLYLIVRDNPNILDEREVRASRRRVQVRPLGVRHKRL